MAKLALVVEKLDEVPEPLRAAYTEREGKYVLDAELPDVEALEAQTAEEKRLREAAEKGMRKAVAESERLKHAKKAADAGLTEERLKEIRDEAEAEVKATLATEIEEGTKAKAQVRALVLDRDVRSRALKLGLLPEKLDDFWTLRGTEFDLTADGKPMVKDKPTVDVDKHLAALLKRNPEWVAGTKLGGGGATGGAGGPGKTGGVTYEDIHRNPEAALARINEAAA